MIRINLLPEGKPTKKKKGVSALGAAGQLNVVLLGLFIAIGLVAIGIRWFVLNSEIKALDVKIQDAQAEVTRLQAILNEVKEFEAQKARLTKKVEIINKLQQNQKGPVRLMEEVSKALPDLLWLDRMEYKGSSIGLTGYAQNQTAVAFFVENLRKVQAFQEPTVKSIVQSTQGRQSVYRFDLTFVFANLDKTQLEAPKPSGDAKPPTATPPAAPASPPAGKA